MLELTHKGILALADPWQAIANALSRLRSSADRVNASALKPVHKERPFDFFFGQGTAKSSVAGVMDYQDRVAALWKQLENCERQLEMLRQFH